VALRIDGSLPKDNLDAFLFKVAFYDSQVGDIAGESNQRR